MCTQKRYTENKERRLKDRDRHGGGCFARKPICGSRPTRNSAARSKLESQERKYLKSSSWNNVQICNYSISNLNGRCILAEQSIQCRHIICLLFACLAMSASAQNSISGYDASSSPRPDTTQSQKVLVQDDKITKIPLIADGQISTEGIVTPKGIPQPTDRLTPTKVVNESKEISTNAESKLMVKNENDGEDESVYFILHVFHRYSKNDFLLMTDFEKLLAKIGFIPALNNSEIVGDHSQSHNGGHNDHPHDHNGGHHDHPHGHNGGHNDHLVDHNGSHSDHSHDNNANHSHDHAKHTHDHANHHREHTGHKEKFAPNGLGNSSDFTSTMNNNQFVPVTTSSLQENTSGQQRTQVVDVTTSASSRLRRQVRTILPSQHEEHEKCLSTKELLQLFRYENLHRLNTEHFWHLCPALIDQLDAGYCQKEAAAAGSKDLKSGKKRPSDEHEHTHDGSVDNHHHHDHSDTDPHNHDHSSTNKTGMQEQSVIQSVTAAVWFYALLSVAVISLCSVAGVVVIPNMKRVFYNHILQFLVALAVGAMSGDALLHLFPHAMLSDSHDHHHHHGDNDTDHHGEASSKVSGHMVAVYKGLMALMGIYSFFFLERLFTLFTQNRSGKRERKHRRRRHCSGGSDQRSKAFHMVNSKLETDGGNAPSCEEMVMIVHPNKALRAYADVSHEAFLHRCDESLVHSPPGQSAVAVAPVRDQLALKEDCSTLEGFTNLGVAGWSGDQIPTAVSDAEIIGIIKDSEPVATTHSHSHSHLGPDFVGPLSSVAMMIIVGDMIHNFCDGLAIGAAYAGSVAGGLSTSVAVFCHELPHEIGDFAVLVRSGLTLRKAVYFNLLSSVPSFLGAIIGVAVGNMSSTSPWIFAGVGGMFLYVTLVDLIPEMSSVYTKSGEPWFLHLLLQASGIAVGTTVMLIMSVYEESLLTSFH